MTEPPTIPDIGPTVTEPGPSFTDEMKSQAELLRALQDAPKEEHAAIMAGWPK